MALAGIVALVPRRRHIGRVAALAAAVMIALEICTEHWFYLYIVWFLPMLLIAITWRPGRRGPAGQDAAGLPDAVPAPQ